MTKALVLKKQADLFSVELENGEKFDTVARKNLKRDGIFVGDYVEIDPLEHSCLCHSALLRSCALS